MMRIRDIINKIPTYSINTILLVIGSLLVIAKRFVRIPILGQIGDYVFLVAILLYPVTKKAQRQKHKKEKGSQNKADSI